MKQWLNQDTQIIDYEDNNFKHSTPIQTNNILTIPLKQLLIIASATMKQSFLKIALILSCLTLITHHIQMQCEYISTTWSDNISLQINQREILVPTRYQFAMIVDAADNTVSKSIRDKGTWQSNYVHVIAMFIQPGMNVLNLGSQTGMEAIFMGKIIGAKGKLYILQPYSVSYKIVVKNIYLNNLQKISHIYRVGASNKKQKQNILVYYDNTGGSVIYPQNFTISLPPNSILQQVYVDLVDNILPQQISIDFALIDVQRMQVQALQGMKKVIGRSDNLVVMMEWQYHDNSMRNQRKTIQMLEWLKSKFKFYKYLQNQHNLCQIGIFQQISDTMSLLTLTTMQLFLIPKGINPNNLHRQY